MFFSNKTTACPFCYREFNINKVAFQCSGAGKPGRPRCERQADPRRSEHFGDQTPVMPTIVARNMGVPIRGNNGQLVDVLGKKHVECTSCGATTGIRLCPHCHSRLPRSLDANSPMFGLVGVRNSGKTVFLSVLHETLKKKISRRFNASIDTPGGANGYARSLEQFRSVMDNQSELPNQTSKRGNKHAEPAIYDWKYQDSKGHHRSTVFSFYDSAGEDLADLQDFESQQYLKSANGLILLLDPFAFPHNQNAAKSKGINAADASSAEYTSPETVMSNLTEVLRAAHAVKSTKKIKIPIAIAVSKIDAFFDEIPQQSPIRRQAPESNVFDEQDSLDVHEHMIALIQKWGGDNLVRKVEQEFETFRFFGVSALGAEPNYQSGAMNDRGLLPHRVADPLLWLMANRDFIPST